jgi:SNF2 family DNA or RNA helicase
VSLKAGGTGLNLTAASVVIHYDLWWNPAVESQASDRAWRIGQQRDVLVYRFVTEGTFEERINEMLTEKRRITDLAVSSGENWVGDMSTSELRALFSLS